MASGLTVEIVNDSGQTDANVYLLLTGDSVSITGNELAVVNLPQASGASTSSSALTALSTTASLVSPLTGQTRPIYSFDLQTIVSGRLLVSFGSAITYADNTAPTATSETCRWDKMEFGYPGSGADLTSLDFFGIPMQFEYLDAAGNVLDSATFYTSTATLLGSVLGLSGSMGDAFMPTVSGTSVDLSTFQRVLGPGTIASTATGGSPAPYPSFSGYIASLVANQQSFTVSGTAGVGTPAPTNNAVTYSYTGSFSSDSAGGYSLVLTGTTSGMPYGLYTDTSGTTTAQQVPSNLTVTLALPAASLDINTYAAPATSFTVALSSTSQEPANLPSDWQNYVSNSVYATIAGDILAGLNFGYPGGTLGNDGALWYTNPPPTPFPFAQVRATNDGFYNPYAALLYNYSDAYGFPYSDRGGRPSPYIPQPGTATTLRITILPDVRLDQVSGVTATSPANGELTISWSALTAPTGFTVTHYQIVASYFTSQPGGMPTTTPYQTVVTLPTTTSYTFASLTQGLPYRFEVTALGTGSTGGAVTSYPATVTANAGGTWAAPTGTLPFNITLNWSANTSGQMPTGYSMTIGGQAYDPNSTSQPPITINGETGFNLVPISVTDSSGTVIYSDVYVVNLLATAGAAPGTYTVVGTPFLGSNSQPLAVNWTAQKVPELMLGTPFAPIAGKLPGAVVLPS